MPEIAGGSLGPETKYDVAFTKGAMQISLSYQGKQAGISIVGSVSAGLLVEALAAKVSNPTEKALILGLASIIEAIP